MSTRANIKVIDQYTTEEGWGKPLWFYRHCDGYPSGALPLIKTFCELVQQGKIRDNASQSSGWLILLGASEHDHHWDGFLGWKCGSIEPTHGEHGDIKFLYTIDLYNRQLTVDSLWNEKSVTVHFDDIDINSITKELGIEE